MVLAVGEDNINTITWKQWCRFELNELDSMSKGQLLAHLQAPNLDDIDVLFEMKRTDDESIVWYGCSPLDPGDAGNCSSSEFTSLPHMELDLSKPHESDKFDMHDINYPHLPLYKFWCGRQDVSILQKTLVKALHGLNTSCLLQAHVVLRRRSTGQMITILSNDEPNQIIGEDYGEEAGEYVPCYQNSTVIYAGDDRLGVEISFSICCSAETDEDNNVIHFTTKRDDDLETTSASFCFEICDEEEDDDCQELMLQAMLTWKWD